MLLHKLSSHKGRLLLSVLMLKDANADHYAVPGVECVVSHESRHFADDGHKAFLGHLGHLLRISHASYRRTATYIALAYLLIRKGGTRRVPPQVDQRVQCEGLEGLAQLRRNLVRRTSMRRHCLSSRRGGRSMWRERQLLCPSRYASIRTSVSSLFGSSVHTMRSVFIRTNRVLQSS